MAGNLYVRNLDDELIARPKRRAARRGRSIETEHREILGQALVSDVEPSFDTLASELRKPTKRRKQSPSEIPLREGRKASVNALFVGPRSVPLTIVRVEKAVRRRSLDNRSVRMPAMLAKRRKSSVIAATFSSRGVRLL